MADLSSYVRGNKVIARAEFRVPDETGPLTDPSTITFTATKQERNATPTTYVYGVASEVIRVSAGIYELALVPAEGTWHVHVQGTGAAYAAMETSFEIRHSRALA